MRGAARWPAAEGGHALLIIGGVEMLTHSPHSRAFATQSPTVTVVVSRVSFLRDCIEDRLSHDPFIQVIASCAGIEDAISAAKQFDPLMVLLDAAFPGGTHLAARLRLSAPDAIIVVVALAETEANVLNWAEVGVSGYIPDTASLHELPDLLRQIRRGEQSCSSRIAGSLLRRIGRADAKGGAGARPPRLSLTPQERVILRHIGAGLSNKDIARRLDIGLGTAKTHVHNIFGKLNLKTRTQVAALLGRPDRERTEI